MFCSDMLSALPFNRNLASSLIQQSFHLISPFHVFASQYFLSIGSCFSLIAKVALHYQKWGCCSTSVAAHLSIWRYSSVVNIYNVLIPGCWRLKCLRCLSAYNSDTEKSVEKPATNQLPDRQHIPLSVFFLFMCGKRSCLPEQISSKKIRKFSPDS